MKHKLHLKGWNVKEIDKTLRIIRRAKENKHPHIKVLDSWIFWIALLVTIIGNFLVSVSLIPLLFALPPLLLYTFIVIIGVSFGLLFEMLIRSMTHLKAHHHIFFGLIIPSIAIINIFIINRITENIENMLNITNPQDPFIVSVFYAASFILPYLFYNIFIKEKSL